jgi:ATP-binding cassette, subfamily D (ALD), member 3
LFALPSSTVNSAIDFY